LLVGGRRVSRFSEEFRCTKLVTKFLGFLEFSLVWEVYHSCVIVFIIIPVNYSYLLSSFVLDNFLGSCFKIASEAVIYSVSMHCHVIFAPFSFSSDLYSEIDFLSRILIFFLRK
jgi:hypothetical protein